MTDCNANGLHDINASYPDSAFNLETGYPDSAFGIETVYPDSAFYVCAPNIDYLGVYWYVFGDNVVTISDKYFGYVFFK